jgi:hypothetical protein
MRVFVVASGVRIAPFGDLAPELPVGGKPLRAWQQELFSRFGLERVEVARIEDVSSSEPHLVTWDNVFFTRRVLKSFLELWRALEHRPSRLALPADSGFIRLFSTLSDADRDPSGKHALFRLYGMPGGPGSLESAAPLPVIYKERMLQLPMPRRVSGIERWEHPVTSSVCMHLRHWVQVLQANLLSIQVRWVDQVITNPLWAAGVLLRALMPWPGRGALVGRIAKSANRVGRRVQIHPTALVEGCFIDDGAVIGPRAIVRGSIIGRGATVEQAADVSFSVIGPGCFVSKHSILWAVAAFEGSDLCMKGMQMCLVGSRAALTARASPIDLSPGHKIRVLDGDRLVEIELPLLGSCYGHDTFIGADVFVGPGRAIPNGIRVVPPPERVLSRIPRTEPGKTYYVKNGTLEELE